MLRLSSYFAFNQKLALIVSIVSIVSIGNNAQFACASQSNPKWIWIDNRMEDVDSAYFQKVFSVDDETNSAQMRIIGYLSDVEVFINGEFAGEATGNGPIVDFDVTTCLNKGKNLIAVHCKKRDRLPAVFVQVVLGFPNGESKSIYADGTWKASVQPTPKWSSSADAANRWISAKVVGDMAPEFHAE